MNKNYFRSLVLLVVVFLTVTGCSESPDTLVGTYSIDLQGKKVEYLRITKEGDKFLLSEKQEGRWLAAVEVHPIDKDFLEGVLNNSVNTGFVGLGNKNVVIVSVPVGWKSGGFDSKTGIWMSSIFGPMDLYK